VVYPSLGQWHRPGRNKGGITAVSLILNSKPVVARAGQVGANIPIPFPAFFHGLGSWKGTAVSKRSHSGPQAADLMYLNEDGLDSLA
jgi:hypothetical protein